MLSRMIATAAAGFLLFAGTAQAAPNDRAPRCFTTQFFNTWKAPDERTIYIRVGVHDFYRLDLATRCPALHAINPHLVTRWRGSNFVCSALDWDLKVSRGVDLGADPCIVKTMTPLTNAEADAIPRKFRP